MKRFTGFLVLAAFMFSWILQGRATAQQFVQQGNELIGSDAGVGSGMIGGSVSLSSDGNTAMMGWPADNGGVGAVWVFTRGGGAWSQQGNKIVATDAVGGAGQGISVSLSADGSTALVGGWFDNSHIGAAWVFTRSDGIWSEQAKLVGTDVVGSAPPLQGFSVSLSADGNTALVGGYKDNGSQGAAWVFTRSARTWSQQAKLVGTGVVGYAEQGYSVSLSADGNTALVGGFHDGTNAAGATWVFVRSEGTWSQQGGKLVGTGMVSAASQGWSVSLSGNGNTAIVGGINDDNGSGAAWVFASSGSVWSQQAKLLGTGAVGSAAQGYSVSLSHDGNTAIVGGHRDNSSIGGAWIFRRNGGVWSQEGSKLVGTGGNMQFEGTSVSLSSDGTTAIVGAQGTAWVFTSTQTVVGDPAAEMPRQFDLEQNYPNPFNPATTIQFSIVNRQLTIVKVFDVLGREAATLVNDVKEPGTYTVQFDGADLASGVYFYRLQAGDFTQTKRLVLLK